MKLHIPKEVENKELISANEELILKQVPEDYQWTDCHVVYCSKKEDGSLSLTLANSDSIHGSNLEIHAVKIFPTDLKQPDALAIPRVAIPGESIGDEQFEAKTEPTSTSTVLMGLRTKPDTVSDPESEVEVKLGHKLIINATGKLTNIIFVLGWDYLLLNKEYEAIDIKELGVRIMDFVRLIHKGLECPEKTYIINKVDAVKADFIVTFTCDKVKEILRFPNRKPTVLSFKSKKEYDLYRYGQDSGTMRAGLSDKSRLENGALHPPVVEDQKQVKESAGLRKT